MVEYLKTFGEHLIFEKNENGIIMGGYPIEKIVLEQIGKYEMLGGTKESENFGLSQFKNLAVPLGLYVEKDINDLVGGGSQSDLEKLEKTEVISEDHFNKLFDLVSVTKGGLSKKYSRKNVTINKSKNNTKNKTRKNE